MEGYFRPRLLSNTDFLKSYFFKQSNECRITLELINGNIYITRLKKRFKIKWFLHQSNSLSLNHLDAIDLNNVKYAMIFMFVYRIG